MCQQGVCSSLPLQILCDMCPRWITDVLPHAELPSASQHNLSTALIPARILRLLSVGCVFTTSSHHILRSVMLSSIHPAQYRLYRTERAASGTGRRLLSTGGKPLVANPMRGSLVRRTCPSNPLHPLGTGKQRDSESACPPPMAKGRCSAPATTGPAGKENAGNTTSATRSALLTWFQRSCW
jgi:hypothetical protein